MKHVHICLFWHMHQPYYTDPVAGSASMPWVRLHATKAYYDMGHLLEKFPAIRSTFNFTPSLLLQLQEIGSGRVRDPFLEYAQRPAADLTSEEQCFLIRHFFSANWATMVRPYPRYHELLVQRGVEARDHALEGISRRFSTQDYLDLQVWHNLAWFGYGTVSRYPRLGALRNKNRGFTEEDKQEVLAIQHAALQEVIPLYRHLVERGQVELTTTPFFHPILPLLIDTDFTKRARPDLQLPTRFRAPEDAEAQVRQAVSFHHQTFGRPPTGLWPSEGSVCPEILPLVHGAGLRWLATDEGILARSFDVCGRPWHRHSALYRPYRVGEPGQELSILFRDRDLSDAFGFVYQKTRPESAADDVLRRLRGIIRDIPHDQSVVAVILDGENPWEHYHDGGEQLLSLLYSALTNHELDERNTVEVHASTVSAAIAAAPPTEHLPVLHSGSWINSDYKIWIGHQEDNHGWELLGHTRTRLIEIAPTLPPDRAQAAWNELYAAEGSDWFWWYGDDFDTDYREEFDRLFRSHLRNVWVLMGISAPDLLNQPLRASHGASDEVTSPVNLISPTLDGLVTGCFEWRGAGTINPSPPPGTMWKAQGLFTAIYFGCSVDYLYFRMDFDDASENRQPGLSIDIFVQQAAGRTSKLSFSLAPPGPESFLLQEGLSGGPFTVLDSLRSICRRTVLELGISFKDLHAEIGSQLSVSLAVLEQGMEVARFPNQNTVSFTAPSHDFDAGTWKA